MAEKIYLDSTRVHIYPCANRGAGIDIESKLTTESNLINLPARLDPVSSTGLDFINHKLIFIIGGYYIEADLTGETDLQSNCWADYKLAVANLTMSKTGTETYVTKSNMLSNYETGSFELDTSDGKFKGIAFSTKKIVTEADTCVQLLENGTLVEQGLFGNITRKGGIAGDAAEPKTDDYLVFLDHKNNNKITKLSPAFDKNKSDMFLSQDGTFRKATLDKYKVTLDTSDDVHFEDRDKEITSKELQLSVGESRLLKCVNTTENQLTITREGGVEIWEDQMNDSEHRILAVLNGAEDGIIHAKYKVWKTTDVTLTSDTYAGITYYSDASCEQQYKITQQHIEGYVGESEGSVTIYIKMSDSKYKYRETGNIDVNIQPIGEDKYSCKLSLTENTETKSSLGIAYENYSIDFKTENETNGVEWYSKNGEEFKVLSSIKVSRDDMKTTSYTYNNAYCKVTGESQLEDIQVNKAGSVIDVKPITTTLTDYQQYELTIGGKGKVGNGSVTATADKRYKIELSGIISGSSSSSIFWTETETGTQHITEYYTKKDEEKIVYLHINNPPSSEYYNHSIIHSSQGDGIEVDSEEISSTSNIIYRVTITAKETISANDKLTSTVTFTEKYKTVSIYTLAYPTQAASSPSANKSTGRAGKDSVSVAQGTAATGWKWKQWSRQIDTNNWAEGYKTTESITDEEIPSTATTKVTYRADYKVSVEAKVQPSAMGTVEITGSDVEYKTSGDKTSGWVWSKNGTRSNPIVFTATAKTGYKFTKWVDTSTGTPQFYTESFSIAPSANIENPLDFTAKFEEISEYTVNIEENNRYYWTWDAEKTNTVTTFDIQAGDEQVIYANAIRSTADNIKFKCIPVGAANIESIGQVEDQVEVKIDNVTANCTICAYNNDDEEVTLTNSLNDNSYEWVSSFRPSVVLSHAYTSNNNRAVIYIARNTAIDLNHALIIPSESVEFSSSVSTNYILVTITNASASDENTLTVIKGNLITFKSNEGYTWYKADGTTSLSSALIKTNDTFAAKIKNSSGTCNYISLAIDPDTALLAGITPGATSATVRLSNVTADCVITPSTIPEYTVTLEENNRYYWVASSGSTQRISSITLHESDTKNIYVVSKNDDSEYLNINQSSSKINVIYTPEAGTSITEVKLSGCKANCILKPYDAGDIEITLNNTDAQYKWVSNDDATNSITHAYWSSATNTNIRVAKNESALDVSFAGIEETGGSTIDITQQIVNDYINVEITSASEEETNILNVYQGKKIWFDENNKYYFATDTAGVNICTERLVKYGGTTAVYAIAKSGTCSSISAGISGGSTKAKISAPVSSNKYTRAIISDVYEHCVVYAKNESDFCVTLSVSDEEKLQWLAEDFKRRQRLYLSSAETAVVYIEALSGYVGDVEFTTANCSITEGTTPLENLRKITVSNPTSDEARVTASV